MARFRRTYVRARAHTARNSADPLERGRALEQLVRHVFSAVPGVFPPIGNIVDFADGGEIDIFFPNKGVHTGFWFLPTAILAECKNWQGRVGAEEVRVFIDRLRERACRAGILIAANGITGDAESLTAARRHIARALEQDVRVLVMTLEDLENIRSAAQFVRLLLEKWTRLSSFLSSI
jgi:hypothetical protein